MAVGLEGDKDWGGSQDLQLEAGWEPHQTKQLEAGWEPHQTKQLEAAGGKDWFPQSQHLADMDMLLGRVEAERDSLQEEQKVDNQFVAVVLAVVGQQELAVQAERMWLFWAAYACSNSSIPRGRL